MAFLESSRRRSSLASAELETALRGMREQGRAAWSEIILGAAEFAREIGARVDAGDDALMALSRIHSADLYLACACARGAPRAIEYFESAFLSRVPKFLARLDPTGALASEVVQALRERLLVAQPGAAPRIGDYSGRGDLLSWLRVVALRDALKLQRAQQHQDGGLEEPSADIAGGPDPERDYLKLRYRGEYDDAFRAALAALESGERLLLKLRYVDGLNIDRIGSMYRLHRSTVARRLAAHRRKLLELIRAHLRERLRLSDSEFRSIFTLVRSQMAVSLRSALY